MVNIYTENILKHHKNEEFLNKRCYEQLLLLLKDIWSCLSVTIYISSPATAY